MTPAEQIARLREIERGATPAPWETRRNSHAQLGIGSCRSGGRGRARIPRAQKIHGHARGERSRDGKNQTTPEFGSAFGGDGQFHGSLRSSSREPAGEGE